MSHGRQGPGPAGPGAQGARLGRPAGRGHHLQEGDEPARLLHPAGLLAVRRGRRGRRAAPRSSSVGQLVAAAGNEYALHAEYNWVPVNLCVPGARRGRRPSTRPSPPSGRSRCRACGGPRSQLGETACVIGLGLVGQLVVRLLVAAGVRVVGVDVVEDRCRLAEKAGALLCADPGEAGIAGAAAGAWREVTDGRGADHILLAAGGSSQRPGRGSRQAGPGPRPGRRHRQDRAWTCRGTPTTTRNSTSGSPGRTALAGTTTGTSSTASTTRPATCAGPSGATWNASST